MHVSHVKEVARAYIYTHIQPELGSNCIMTGCLADVRTDSSMRSSSRFCVLVSSKMASGVVSTLSSVGLPPLPAVVPGAVRPNGPDVRRRRCRWADEVKRGEWTAALWKGDVGWRARDDGAWKACADGGPPVRPMATTAAAALFRLAAMILLLLLLFVDGLLQRTTSSRLLLAAIGVLANRQIDVIDVTSPQKGFPPYSYLATLSGVTSGTATHQNFV